MDSILNYEKNDEDDFYKILNCDELSSIEQIVTEYKVLALECHPDKNPGDVSAGEKFANLQRAKDVLTNQETRKKYDNWRAAGIAMSYDQWCALRDTVHTSMHWASVKKQPMLEEEAPHHSNESRKQGHTKQTSGASTHSNSSYKIEGNFEKKPSPWERDPASDTLTKFRNYEI